MPLYQTSVLKNYLKRQDKETVAKAFKKFSKYFHNTSIQQNIRDSKEEQFQEGFLRELFVDVLGYTLNPHPNFNLTTELKNEKGARKADGAILTRGHDPLSIPIAIGVIELKSTKTKDLESIRQQAFDYKANQTGCVYVVTSNFEKLRFYINNAVEFEEFDLFTLTENRFELLYLCLHKDNLLSNVPLKIKEASVREEEVITKQFYNDYSLFKRELFRDLVKLNMKNEVFRSEFNREDTERANKNIKHNLFKKSQKLIDRFLFIFFAEDRDLLPPNSTLKILEQWNKLKDLDAYVPLYERFKLYFGYLDTGRKGTDKGAEIFAYNGGLFKPDPILDSLQISDELLFKHTEALSNYDFESQVDVNILGHIFENSLNEIESVNAEIEGVEFDAQKTKRKKDGVFYTPKYITKYIVENTVGKLCAEKKTELNIVDEEYTKDRKGRTTAKLKELKDQLDNYRNWLLQLTICDPACGSGAFLNQALDFLIKEHQYIDELQTSLLGGGFVFPDIENTVLENNIFGVDLNEESVEIAKLSLWLRTAQPRRKLNDLSSNIKCGNSLIDDPKVAGNKAFKWEEEFPQIFKEKEKKAFHITTATHDSRTSQRMVDYKVRALRDNGLNPKAQPIWLEPEDEILITNTIAEIIKEDELNVMAYNICGDHMHLLLVCEGEEVSKVMQKIKAKTARTININKGITSTREHAPLSTDSRGEKQNSLWTQKFGCKEITDEKQLWNTIEYIQNNRIKHELPPLHSSNNKGASDYSNNNKGACSLVPIEKNELFNCSYQHAFRTEYKGGFDVVIGNPPYVDIKALDNDLVKVLFKSYKTTENRINLYSIFIEKAYDLVKETGFVSFINPNSILVNSSYKKIRTLLIP
ncbi:MAG: transposase [Vicingaceae bacterium]|nr:transposase [Vicingaceae bacterium]